MAETRGAEADFQITFYEILIGRTPFEENEEEDFQEEGRYAVYLERALSGEWLGEYYIPNGQLPAPRSSKGTRADSQTLFTSSKTCFTPTPSSA